MKTTKTFSLDAEIVSKGQATYENFSKRVEELLRADLENYKEEQKSPKKLRAELKRQESIIATLKAEL